MTTPDAYLVIYSEIHSRALFLERVKAEEFAVKYHGEVFELFRNPETSQQKEESPRDYRIGI